MLKRLERDGYILQFPQPKDKPYLYMPNPAKIHHHSSKLDHHLRVADVYIQSGKPEKFHIEPKLHADYIPDLAMLINEKFIVVEVQLTRVANSKMQDKVDRFVRYYSSRPNVELWIVSEYEYSLEFPKQISIRQKPLHD